MTTETKTVTVELSVEAAFAQLVGFKTAAKAFTEAQDKDDKDAMIDAASAAVDSCIDLINDIMPGDLSEQLHQRLHDEHPELEDDPMAGLAEALRAMFGDDFDMSQLGLEEEGK